MWPRWTVTPVVGTSAILMVLFSEALIASARSLPTFLSSTSNAATNSHVADVVLTEVDVHEAGDGGRRVGIAVVVHALHERRRTVADADDGDADGTHVLLLGSRVVGGWTGCRCAGWRDPALRLGAGVGGVAPLGVDELAEPADLALGGLLAVQLQRRGLGVEALAAAGGRLADPLEVLLEAGAAALEDAQAHLALGAGEEGEADVEAVVVPRGGVGAGDEVGEVLLAAGGQLVDDARAPAGAGPVGSAVSAMRPRSSRPFSAG